jgi:transcriptional regulator with XRE-family HTH domain
MDTFSKRLQLLARNKKIDQADLARAMNKSPASINRWFKGPRVANQKSLLELCEYFGCDYDWLKDGIGEPYPAKQNGKIKATIEPGSKEKKQLLLANRNRPTVVQDHLRLIVEWMDEYYAEHPDQSIFFYEDIKDHYPSFREFIEKKAAREAVAVRPPGKLSVNSE